VLKIMRYSFENKVVLVLGGKGNIGTAISDAFGAVGAVVCRHGLTGDYKANLKNSNETKRLFLKVLRRHRKIDVLVNAVSAPITIAPFEKKKWSDFSRHFEVQLKSAVETALLAIPTMKEQKSGAIIHVLSTIVDGDIPASFSDYVTAKYALWGLTQAMAKDLGEYGISVNAVSPSFIPNDFTKKIPTKTHDFIINDTPIGRLATPEDVAQTVLFLASDGACYITGEAIQISGGHHL